MARFAGGQGGAIAHRQLVALGLSPRAIDGRLTAGRLHPYHRGVYAVGHPVLGAEGRRWAAVLALGDDAFISHTTAADAYDIRRSASGLIHVTVRGRGGRKRHAGIRVHRPKTLADDEVTTRDGLPITTPARTILDLATHLSPRHLEAALDRAELLRLLSFDDLHQLLARYRKRPGTRSLKAQLDRHRGPIDARSELERLVYKLCTEHGLPRPHVNTVIEGKVRDLYWPHCRLVVEVDGYAWHRSPSVLNDDRERDVELTLAGYRVLRFTREQVKYRPDYVIRALLRALTQTRSGAGA